MYEAGQAANNSGAAAQLLIGLPNRPDLRVQSVTAPASAQAGGTASLEFVVVNQGPMATTGQWTDRVYLSVDNVISGDDQLLGTFASGAALGTGESYLTNAGTFTIPARYRGSVFLLVQTDSGSQVDEYPRDDNNVFAQPIEIVPLPPADLVVSQVVAPTQTFDGTQVEVRYRVTNLGLGTTDRDQWVDTIWLTQDKNRPSPGISGQVQDYLLASVPHVGALGVGEFYDVTFTVTLPERVTGQWYITPWTDAYDVVIEDTQAVNVNPDDPNELDNNNYRSRPMTVLLTPPPDLVVSSVVAPAAATAGGPLTVRWTVQNVGANATGDTAWGDLVYLSDSPTLDAPGARTWLLTDPKGLPHLGALGAGGSYTVEQTFVLSPEATGQYVIVKTGLGAWEGPYDANNTRAATTVVTAPAADLRVTSVGVPAVNYSGEAALVNWTVQNFGAAVPATTRLWYDYVYVSTDAQFNPLRATLVGKFAHDNTQPLAALASYTRQELVTLPRGIGGNFYVHVLTDPLPIPDALAFAPDHPLDPSLGNDVSRMYYEQSVYEGWPLTTLEQNNALAVPIAITYREPDLRVSSITPLAAGRLGANPIGQLQCHQYRHARDVRLGLVRSHLSVARCIARRGRHIARFGHDPPHRRPGRRQQLLPIA